MIFKVTLNNDRVKEMLRDQINTELAELGLVPPSESALFLMVARRHVHTYTTTGIDSLEVQVEVELEVELEVDDDGWLEWRYASANLSTSDREEMEERRKEKCTKPKTD